MLNPSLVLNISRARDLELSRAAEHARLTHIDTRRERRATRRASEPAPQQHAGESSGHPGRLANEPLR